MALPAVLVFPNPSRVCLETSSFLHGVLHESILHLTHIYSCYSDVLLFWCFLPHL